MLRHVAKGWPNARNITQQSTQYVQRIFVPDVNMEYVHQRFRLWRRKVVACSLVLLVEDDEREVKRGKTRLWIKRRQEKGYFANIVQELMIEDVVGFREMFRMKPTDFQTILRYIEADITPQQILGGNKVITAPERLALTLRFLATGETYRSLSFQFRISRAAISYIIREVCSAIAKHLGPHYLRVPSSPEEWLAIANTFQQKCQYPNCIGAIDGKHIVMQPPPNAGSYFYNYKHTHSVVLMAVVGPDYQCLYADVGTSGRISDGGVWNKCGLAGAIEDGSLSLPPPKLLPYGAEPLPYVLVGDDAFALKPYLMKPYPQHGLDVQKRVYNYRHSRARRISENLFGILANRWRVFKTIMQIPPKTVEEVVMAALTLHNFLRSSISKDVYFPAGLSDSESDNGKLVPGLWRQDSASESFLPLQVPLTGHNATTEAKQVREWFSEYFVNEGAIEWQWERCS